MNHLAKHGPLVSPNNEALRSLQDARPLYFLPKDPLTEEVLIPAFQAADAVNCMTGFFSSEVLASLAPGLATYINRSKNSFRLIVSPLLRPHDLAAMEEGLRSPETVAEEILRDLVITEDLLERHTLRCLAWLLSRGRMEIKIALMKDALFHPKVWLFHAGADVMAVHGSSNVTYAGIRKNIEQIAISKSWEDPNQGYITEKLNHRFGQLWQNDDESCVVVALPQAVRDKLLQTYRTDIPPTEAELNELYARASGFADEPQNRFEAGVVRPSFSIPSYLRYDDGPFEHQGKAVKAWCDAGHRGVLEMATGSGKTITAMICAHRLHEAHKPLLIVVAAPYIPLIQQWCEEIAPFGLCPVNLTLAAGARERAGELNRIKRRFRNGASDVEVVVVSHRTLAMQNSKLNWRNLIAPGCSWLTKHTIWVARALYPIRPIFLNIG